MTRVGTSNTRANRHFTDTTQKMAQELFLWYHPVSSYAQKVCIALREKNIPFKAQVPTGGGSGIKAVMPSSFSEGNLQLEMPVLVDVDNQIFDSTIILEYLEDKYPDIPLRPRSPLERARARMIEEVCDSQYEARIGRWVRSMCFDGPRARRPRS
jgi:glutathione S-transferase